MRGCRSDWRPRSATADVGAAAVASGSREARSLTRWAHAQRTRSQPPSPDVAHRGKIVRFRRHAVMSNHASRFGQTAGNDPWRGHGGTRVACPPSRSKCVDGKARTWLVQAWHTNGPGARTGIASLTIGRSSPASGHSAECQAGAAAAGSVSAREVGLARCRRPRAAALAPRLAGCPRRGTVASGGRPGARPRRLLDGRACCSWPCRTKATPTGGSSGCGALSSTARRAFGLAARFSRRPCGSGVA